MQADTDDERRRAWEFGLSSDGQHDWSRRLGNLSAYRECWGDPHVGFREGDPPELTRWAAKQRSDWRSGELRQDRQASRDILPCNAWFQEAAWGPVCVLHEVFDRVAERLVVSRQGLGKAVCSHLQACLLDLYRTFYSMALAAAVGAQKVRRSIACAVSIMLWMQA